MPATPRANKGTYVELPEQLVADLRALAERNGRTFREELEHAGRRHLAQPPKVEVLVTTPELNEATVQVAPPEPQARRPRGRPRKDQGQAAQAKAPPAAEEDQGEATAGRGRKGKG